MLILFNTFKKVKAIAPPINISSTYSIKFNINYILSFNFAPPIIILKGFYGLCKILSKYYISF